MGTVIEFLKLVGPHIAPVLSRAPELAAQFRAAFVKVGGDGADFDKILADNQVDIDKLADPDQFRHKPQSGPPAPPHVQPSGPGLYDTILTALPARADYQPGDKVYQHGEEEKFFVMSASKPRLGGEVAAPWHLIETF